MPFSNSTNFDMLGSEIIKHALILCGGLEDDEEPSSSQSAHAMRSLNMLVKSWGPKGLKAWALKELTLPLVVGVNSYTIGPDPLADLETDRPLRIENARRLIDGEETPVRIVPRADFMNQPSKDDRSTPVFIFYDPQLTLGVLYVWPSPSATDSILFTARQQIEDFDLETNNPYFPSEWLLALVYNLALLECPLYQTDPNRIALIRDMAREYLMEAEYSDRELGSLFIVPEMNY